MTTSCSKINCGPITVSGDFDSGNVLKAELIYPPPSESDHRIRNPKAGLSSSSSLSPPVAFQLENQGKIGFIRKFKCYFIRNYILWI